MVGIREETKTQLDSLKKYPTDSYDKVIVQLIEENRRVKELEKHLAHWRRDAVDFTRIFKYMVKDPERAKILTEAVQEAKAEDELELEEAPHEALVEEEKEHAEILKQLPPTTKAEVDRARQIHRAYKEASCKGLKEFTFEGKRFKILTPEEQKTRTKKTART